MVLREYISNKIHLLDFAVCLACLCTVTRSSNNQNSSSKMSNLISWQIYYESCIFITSSIDLCKKKILAFFSDFRCYYKYIYIYFLVLLQTKWIKTRDPGTRFSCEFCEIFKNIYYIENLRTTTSATTD